MATAALAKLTENKTALYVTTGATVVTSAVVLYKLVGGDTGFRTNFFAVGNTGAIDRKEVKGLIDGYEEFFSQVCAVHCLRCVRTVALRCVRGGRPPVSHVEPNRPPSGPPLPPVPALPRPIDNACWTVHSPAVFLEQARVPHSCAPNSLPTLSLTCPLPPRCWLQEEGKGVGARKFNTPKFVDHFYSLITDFYEYGWCVCPERIVISASTSCHSVRRYTHPALHAASRCRPTQNSRWARRSELLSAVKYRPRRAQGPVVPLRAAQ